MIAIRKSWTVSLAVTVAVAVAWPSSAQEATEPAPPAPQIEPPPQIEPAQQHHRWNNTVNTWERSASDNGDTFQREHSVVNPRGQMTQTWNRSRTEEGYQLQRRQTWTAPDGTLRRQHEMTLSGTDPYNYQRQKSITLPHERTMTMEQTRTWDGTSGTMERTFSGPNGQTRTFQRSWSPDDSVGQDPQNRFTNREPARVTEQSRPSPPPAKEGFWSKLNPFRRSGADAGKSTPDAGRRRGFTVGAGSPGMNGHRYGLAKKQPGQVELPGQAAARNRARTAHGPDNAPGHSGTKPGRGKNR